MDDRSIRILIVEDSRSAGLALARLLAPFTVVGIARSGEDALGCHQSLRPSLITMDIDLPDMNGLELTRELTRRRPVPIIVVSSLVDPSEQRLVFEALCAGAYDVLPKSACITPGGDPVASHRLPMLVRAAVYGRRVGVGSRGRSVPDTEIPATPLPVGSTLPSSASGGREPPPQVAPLTSAQAAPRPAAAGTAGASTSGRLARQAHQPRAPEAPGGVEGTAPPELPGFIAIGASTGGPAALKRIVAGLPADFPRPVLVAQHMADGFVEGFARWLDDQTPLEVRIVSNGERPAPGRIYFAPSGHHLTVDRRGRARLTPQGQETHCPSVDQLLTSVGDAFGRRAICVVLTGMGSDGARGLMAARQRGAATAVQDEESSVVYGMPREALVAGGAQDALPLGAIAAWLTRHATTTAKAGTPEERRP